MDELPDFSTKPKDRDIVKEDGPHAVLVRVHQADWNILKVMLKRDELSFQKFVAHCARAYLDGDPDIVRAVRRYRTLDVMPHGEVSKGVFSNRERAEIFAELEKERGE